MHPEQYSAPAVNGDPGFAELLRMGEQAARRAIRENNSEPKASGLAGFFRSLWLSPALKPALAVLLLGCIGLSGWLVLQNRRGEVDAGLAALDGAWTKARPVESRVSGPFSYRAWSPTLGVNAAGVDENKLRLAELEINRAAEAPQPSTQALHNLGRLWLLKGKYQEAARQFNEVMARDPQNAAAHADLAAALYERGLLEQSTELFNSAEQAALRALRISPRLPEALFNLALIHEHTNRDQAIADWQNFRAAETNEQWREEAMRRLLNLGSR
ncbi:MAG: tetratricopeptide repeat protein [Blastocatellia bacterium]